MRTHAAALLVGVVPTLLPAQTFLPVPATFPTIQSAIAAAAPGDTVLVSPGTYVENIDFVGKAIIVRSFSGPQVTTIDGNQAGPVVTFATNEQQTSVLDGFTITNGLGASALNRSGAGGIDCVSASPTIRRCIVTNNTGGPGAPATSIVGGAGGAGGIQATGSWLKLVDCVCQGNFGGVGGPGATGPFGGIGGRGGAGGAYLEFNQLGNSPEILRCQFIANHGGDGAPIGGRGGDGGFEMLTFVTTPMTRVVISGNQGGTGGAANGPGTSAGFGGHGGFDITSSQLYSGTVTLGSCAVVGNTGGDAGVGPNAYGGNGGGTTGSSTFRMTNSTVAGNTSGLPLINGHVIGGLTVGGFINSQATLTNCIVWGNTRAGQPSDLYSNGIVTQANSCSFGAVTGTILGSGNLGGDPLFVNLVAGDVHLTAASPCRHAGTSIAGMPNFDFEGDPRIVGSAADIGADEFDGLVGSREDFVLSFSVNGAFAPDIVTSTPAPGAFVLARVTSPAGAFANDLALLAADVWLPPSPPVGPASFPEIHIALSAPWLAIYSAGVGAVGQSFGATIPPGLTGLAMRLQAFCVSGAAANGAFATTAARDVVF